MVGFCSVSFQCGEGSVQDKGRLQGPRLSTGPVWGAGGQVCSCAWRDCQVQSQAVSSNEVIQSTVGSGSTVGLKVLGQHNGEPRVRPHSREEAGEALITHLEL